MLPIKVSSPKQDKKVYTHAHTHTHPSSSEDLRESEQNLPHLEGRKVESIAQLSDEEACLCLQNFPRSLLPRSHKIVAAAPDLTSNDRRRIFIGLFVFGML